MVAPHIWKPQNPQSYRQIDIEFDLSMLRDTMRFNWLQKISSFLKFYSDDSKKQNFANSEKSKKITGGPVVDFPAPCSHRLTSPWMSSKTHFESRDIILENIAGTKSRGY